MHALARMTPKLVVKFPAAVASRGGRRALAGLARVRLARPFLHAARRYTPHPRSYEQAMPKKMRRAALRSALSVKAAEASVVVVDQLVLSEFRTRHMAKALTALTGDSSVLLVLPGKDAYEGVIRSTRNIPDAKILLAGYLNIRDLMVYDKVVLPLASLDVISANLG
jgi:large subunit ribosomal protein L4